MGILHHQGESTSITTTTATSAAATSTPTSSQCIPLDVLAASGHVAGDFDAQRLMLIISAVCGVLTVLISFVSIMLHLLHHKCVQQQKYMIPIHLLPPAWAIYAVLSVAFYRAEPYLTNLPKLHEAIAISALFGLFLSYVTPRSERDAFFASTTVLDRKTKQPLHDAGSLKWFKIQHIKVMQFPVVMLLVIIITEIVAGTVCDSSKTFSRANAALNAIATISTFISLLGILALLSRFKQHMAAHHALRQLVAAKAVVFVVTLQTFAFNIAFSHGAFTPTDSFSEADFRRGLPNTLSAVEMLLASIAFALVFSYRPFARPSFALLSGEHASAAQQQQQQQQQRRADGGALASFLAAIYIPELCADLAYAARSLRQLGQHDEARLYGAGLAHARKGGESTAYGGYAGQALLRDEGSPAPVHLPAVHVNGRSRGYGGQQQGRY